MAAFAAYQSAGFNGNMTVWDMVEPDMKHLVHPHWQQFPPMNPLWHSILGFFMFVVGMISMTGNYIVLSVFTSTRSLRTPSNLFVVNLAFSDFVMMFCMGPAMVMSCYHGTWRFGPLACQLYAFSGSLLGCVSIWSMVMIALDRYNVIVKGIAGKPLTSGGAMLKIACVWLGSLLLSGAPFFGWNKYVPEGNMTACGTDYLNQDWGTRSYIFFLGVVAYWTPLLTIIYCYFFILKAVIAHEDNMREQAKKMNVASLRSAENANQSAECKLAKVALMTITLWFMAWTPYLIINTVGVIRKTKITPLATIWGSVFAKLSAVYNPIVYAISHPKYKVALQQKYPSLGCAAVPEPAACDAQSNATAATDEEQKA